jgi:hypothetical protein
MSPGRSNVLIEALSCAVSTQPTPSGEASTPHELPPAQHPGVPKAIGQCAAGAGGGAQLPLPDAVPQMLAAASAQHAGAKPVPGIAGR